MQVTLTAAATAEPCAHRWWLEAELPGGTERAGKGTSRQGSHPNRHRGHLSQPCCRTASKTKQTVSREAPQSKSLPRSSFKRLLSLPSGAPQAAGSSPSRCHCHHHQNLTPNQDREDPRGPGGRHCLGGSRTGSVCAVLDVTAQALEPRTRLTSCRARRCSYPVRQELVTRVALPAAYGRCESTPKRHGPCCLTRWPGHRKPSLVSVTGA